MAKTKARIVTCGTDEREHQYLDNCWNCAPFWWKIPLCPTHNRKLTTAGYCRDCRRFYDVSEQHTTTDTVPRSTLGQPA